MGNPKMKPLDAWAPSGFGETGADATGGTFASRRVPLTRAALLWKVVGHLGRACLIVVAGLIAAVLVFRLMAPLFPEAIRGPAIGALAGTIFAIFLYAAVARTGVRLERRGSRVVVRVKRRW